MADNVLSCNIYVSEGRDATVIEKLRLVAAKSSESCRKVAFARHFVDVPYHVRGEAQKLL